MSNSVIDPFSDLIIIGSGPASLTAAIYAARSDLSVKIFEKAQIGGILPEITELPNFPGFTGSGQQFANKLRDQVKNLGVSINYGECTEIIYPSQDKPYFKLIIDQKVYHSFAVLIATGSKPKRLTLPTSKPLHYCALCDGPFYKGKSILVIGGGNSAVGESIHLAQIVDRITLVSRGQLTAESSLIRQLKAEPNVQILENTVATPELIAEHDGIFVFIGKLPATDFLEDQLLDSKKYILTDQSNMTKIPGLFAAGDVRSGTLKQAVSAAADGALAAVNIVKYIKK